MKTSNVSSTGAIIVVNSAVQENEEQAPATPSASKKQELIYRIGDEIVSETVFNRYDLNKDGIISDTEKAAYEKANGKNTEKENTASTGNIINTEA